MTVVDDDTDDIAEVVKLRINKKFGQLFRETEEGTYQPHVCIICDEFLDRNRIETLTIDLLEANRNILCPKQYLL